MTANLENFPAPFLGGPLTGKTEGASGKRNADGAARAFANCKAYGYRPASAPAVGETITVDGESKTVKADADGRRFVDVLSRKGEIIAGWFGYPGSEHLMIVHCVICDQWATVYNSHVRRGASHSGCTARGKAARVAAVEAMTGAAVVAPGPQVQPNGSTGRTAPAAEVSEATEATETAETVKAEAAEDAAESRPEPEPEAQPPKGAKVRPLGSNQWRALDGMLNHPASMPGLESGVWDSGRPGWHLGTLSGTVRIFDSLTRAGLVTHADGRYEITAEGRARHAADDRTRLTVGRAGAQRANLKPAEAEPQDDGDDDGRTGMDILRDLLHF